MVLSEGEVDRLIPRAQAGDQDALSRLCACYRPFLRTIAELKLGPATQRRIDASDVVQETEIELVRGIRSFRGTTETELSAWLKQMLKRNIADKVRDNHAAMRDMRREHYLDGPGASASVTWVQPADGEATPSKFVVQGESALRIAAALESLPEDQRAVVRMRYMEEMKLVDIAAALEKTPGAVAGLLRRGQEALRDKIGSMSQLL
jgi:RNA polymerase sigma-70 factor (ECF subfamily)